jgi:hypothetical protein
MVQWVKVHRQLRTLLLRHNDITPNGVIISPLRTAGARSNAGSGFVYPRTNGGSRIMVAVPCNDSDGNQRPRRGNRFFMVAFTVTSPVESSVIVTAETCE